MKTKYTRFLVRICAAVMMIAALSVSAFAASPSVADQMAANSAAWHIANAAGDTATCNALHAANEALANQAASGGGSASYNSTSGTWSVSTASGSTISSYASSNGKQTTSTYVTTMASGIPTQTSVDAYSAYAIASYMANGGTNAGLETSYNNAANYVSSTGNYGDTGAVSSAAAEAAVAKQLLGLTDVEAAKLQSSLETAKQDYVRAENAYKAALASGNDSAIAAAQAQKDAAHAAAQATRAAYNYSGDSAQYNDGGYYNGGEASPLYGSGGGFFVTNITATYNISASAGTGGTISPSGTVTVKKGETKTFSIAPNQGYEIAAIIVDGRSVGAVNSYTFSNVAEAHTITASFRANGTVKLGDAVLTDSLGESLYGRSIKSGYGIKVSVPVTEKNVTDISVAVSYNFGGGNRTVRLEKSGDSYVFPKNSDSPTGARCVYIPAATKDGRYSLTVSVTAKNFAGETVSDSRSATVNVKGSMYEDDFTADS